MNLNQKWIFWKLFLDEEEESDEDEKEEYKYPGEPKKPNPPVPVDFEITFDRSPEFNHEPRDIFPGPRNPKKGRGPYGHPRIEEDEEISNLFTESAIEIEEGDEEDPRLVDEEEGKEENELGNEENEEIEEDTQEIVEENEETAEEPESDEEEQESNLPETYEESGSYEESDAVYRPNSYRESHSYTIPGGSYEESSSYSHPDSYSHSYSSHREEPEQIVDKKKGTREYYKHHKKPESDDIDHADDDEDDDDDDKRRGNIVDGRDTKLVFKKKRFLPKKPKPVLIFKYNKKPKYKKLKIKFKKPRKWLYVGGRFARQATPKNFKTKIATPRKVPDNSAYQLSSDLDLDYQKI